MKKLMFLIVLMSVSFSTFADVPQQMIISKGDISCSLIQGDDYLCQAPVNGSDSATNSLILSYADIVNIGGKSFVPVTTYQLATK